MKTESHKDPHDPATVVMRIDPDHCDGCPRRAKCKMRIEGNAHKCRKGRDK